MITSLVTYLSRAQVAAALPNDATDEARSRGIMAGLLAASRELLPDPEFQRLVASCELSPADVAELLSIAQADSSDTTEPSDPTIEV